MDSRKEMAISNAFQSRPLVCGSLSEGVDGRRGATVARRRKLVCYMCSDRIQPEAKILKYVARTVRMVQIVIDHENICQQICHLFVMSVDLRQWLQAAAILTGQQNGQTSGSTNPASSLIATRLIEAHAAIPGRSTDAAALETLNEDALRLRAGYLAYEISVNLHSISKSLPLSDAPTFSVADTQSLQLLGGVLAGWGIAPYCDRGLLSSQAAVPLPDCSDEIRVQRLQERIQGCLDCVLPQASMQPSTSTNTLPSPQEQLADILLKPCLFAIYPGLIELAFKLQLPWAQQKIKVFFQW